MDYLNLLQNADAVLGIGSFIGVTALWAARFRDRAPVAVVVTSPQGERTTVTTLRRDEMNGPALRGVIGAAAGPDASGKKTFINIPPLDVDDARLRRAKKVLVPLAQEDFDRISPLEHFEME
jgi:hypothetical protein